MSSNHSDNETGGAQAAQFSAYAPVMFQTIGCIIILLNLIAFIIVTFRKSDTMKVISRQISCLSANDTLAGLASILLSLTDSEGIGNSFVACAAILTFSITVQSASLLMIFGISLFRFLTIKKVHIRKSLNKAITIATFVVPWFVSTTLCTSSAFLYSDLTNFAKSSTCTVFSLYGNNVHAALNIALGGAFLIPLVLINAIYVALYCSLSKVSPQPQTNRNRTVTSNSLHVPSTPLDASNISETGTKPSNHASTSTWKNETQLTEQISTPHLNASDARSMFQTTRATSCLTTAAVPNARSSITRLSPDTLTTRRLRKAFVLIGLVLLFLNVCLLPGVVMVLTRNHIFNGTPNRDVSLTLFFVLYLNSAINPVLYAAVIPDFRASLIRAVQHLWRKLTRRT